MLSWWLISFYNNFCVESWEFSESWWTFCYKETGFKPGHNCRTLLCLSRWGSCDSASLLRVRAQPSRLPREEGCKESSCRVVFCMEVRENPKFFSSQGTWRSGLWAPLSSGGSSVCWREGAESSEGRGPGLPLQLCCSLVVDSKLRNVTKLHLPVLCQQG